MKSKVSKVLAAIALGLVINGVTQTPPASAAPGEYKQLPRYMDQLPRGTQDAIIIGTFAVIGAATLVGTGLSIKYEKKPSQKNGERHNIDKLGNSAEKKLASVDSRGTSHFN